MAKMRLKENGDGSLKMHWGLREFAVIIGIIGMPTFGVVKTYIRAENNEADIEAIEQDMAEIEDSVDDNETRIVVNETMIENVGEDIKEINDKLDDLIMLNGGGS